MPDPSVADTRLRLDAAVAVRPSRVPDLARDAEERGLHRIAMSEARYNPFLQLARAGDATERVELATSVAVAFARTPMALAYEAWGLHESSGGRAVIGLGSQVKSHVVHRFGMEWSRPAARMAEYVMAVRAIWESWQSGAKLDFRGDFYSHTLMTPRFAPPALESTPPILLAAVGPRMCATAGAVADGFLAHAFTTREYLASQTLPVVRAARAKAEADGVPWCARPFEVTGHVLAAVGETSEEVESLKDGIRERIAFYGSTPAYRPVLELHGWGDLQTELQTLARAGRWPEMGRLVDDEVFDAFAVAGDPQTVAREVHRRYGDLVQGLCLTGGANQSNALLLAATAAIGEHDRAR
jgi:probable F420-dependent oxidoreductase